MDEQHQNLLHGIDKRLAVIEERTKDIPEMRSRLERLTTRVATVASIIGFAISTAVAWLTGPHK